MSETKDALYRDSDEKPPDSQLSPPGFLDLTELQTRIPLSERTIRSLIAKRVIPHVRLPGGRRLLFDWPSVKRSLLRYEEGGIER